MIIKSTVMPGTTDDLQNKHPEHRFFYLPEFLSADTAVDDYANPRRPHVIGVPTEFLSMPQIEETDRRTEVLLSILPPFPGGHDIIQAFQGELLKLATNAWYATKVAFANQLFDIGMEQVTLDAMGRDPWIGNSHLTVMHKRYRGFGGPCLVKDTKALVEYAWDTGKCDRRFLPGEVSEYNKRLMDADTKDRDQSETHKG